MKKRLVAALVIALSLTAFTGCGIISIGQKIAEGTEESASPSPTATPESAEVEPTPTPEIEEVKEPELIFDTAHILIGNTKAYIVDTEGEPVLMFECDENEYFCFAGGDGNRVYVLSQSFDEENQEVKYMLYSLNSEGEMLETPIPYDSVASYYSTVYNGNFYFTKYNEDYEQEIAFYDPHGDAFVNEEEISIVKEIIEKRGFSSLVYGMPSVYTVAENGMIYEEDNDTKAIVLFDKNGGKVHEFKIPYDIGSYEYFGNGYFIGSKYESDEDYNFVSEKMYLVKPDEDFAYCFDERTESKDPVKTVLAVSDGYIYYGLSNYDEIGNQTSCDYYRIKIDESGSVAEKIGSSLSDKHTSTYVQGAKENGFKVIEGNCYYLTFNGSDLEWRVAKTNELGAFEENDLGLLDYHVAMTDFGTTDYVYDQYKDEDGVELAYSRVEKFRLKDDIENSDRINVLIGEKENKFIIYGKDLINDAKELEDTQWLKDWGSSYSYECSVNYVKKICDHYLEVAYSDYIYMGGAHGMGEFFYFLFDLNTGKEVTIRDLYSKGEASFKDLVAGKSVIMANNHKGDGEYMFYDDFLMKSNEEMYDEFYEAIDMDMSIEYGEEGFTLYYPPYLFGPYASGFIPVFISYEDAGISLK